MSTQDLTFIANVAMAMPSLNKDEMQYWIGNPKKLKAVLKALQRIELHYLHDSVTEVRPMGGAFDPLELILDRSKVRLDQPTRNMLSDHSRALVSFTDYVNYMITKRGATNANVRADLPEAHLFKGDTAYKYTLIANLIQNHELYGGAIGLSPNTPNVLYFSDASRHVDVVEVRLCEDGVWNINNHTYFADKAHEYQFSWPAGTRIYIPSSK